MENEFLFAKMTGEEVKEAASRGKVIFIPVGAIENHGAHLPVDTDNMPLVRMCQEAAQARPDLIVCAPAIHYGYNEHNMDFPGTIDVYPTHFIDYCIDVGKSFAHNGFETIVFVNGHGSNGILLEVAARQVTLKAAVKCASVSYWSLVTEEVKSLRESPEPGGMSHACEFETSLYLYLDEARVVKEKMAANVVGRVAKDIWYDLFGGGPIRLVSRWSQVSPTTMVSGDPTLATAEKGKVFFEAAVRRLIEVAEQLSELELSAPVDHQYKPQ
jgi:creatinine amidohydrolase